MWEIFNQQIDNLPNSITHLKLGHSFDKKVNKLPDSIQEIKVYKNMQIELFPIEYRNIIKIDNSY